MTDRPYVICHILSSIDGRIDGDFFDAPQIGPAGAATAKIRQEYNCDAVLNGTTTCAEIYTNGYIRSLPEARTPVRREDYVAVTDLRKYVVCADSKGKLNWQRNTVDRRGEKSHVIELLTEQVGDAYLAHLQRIGVSYVFAGKETLDIPLALRKLKALFGIKTLLLTGGGRINWSFLRAGVLDELSLVIAPLADGAVNVATIFDRSGEEDGEAFALRLKNVQKLDGDVVWLRYER